MDPRTNTNLGQAIGKFYADNGFPADGGVTEDVWSPVGCRDLKVYLPNFEWRRKALPFHDLHHILTGYPFSPIGEFEMSAWEFAAGRYPNPYSTLFCIPLVGLGALLASRRTFAAFVRGRHSSTLYEGFDHAELLGRSVEDVRKQLLPAEPVAPAIADRIAYAKLVGCSTLVILTPLALGFSVIAGLW